MVLHTVAKRSIGEEFEDIPLITRLDGAIVMLGDVAAVRDGFVDDELVSEVKRRSRRVRSNRRCR